MTAEIVAGLIIAVTDTIINRSRPAGVDEDVWRAQVQAKADEKAKWLKTIVDKHKGDDPA